MPLYHKTTAYMYTDFRQNAVGFIAITNTVRIIVQTQLLLYTQQTRPHAALYMLG